jgi:hypothetical protein
MAVFGHEIEERAFNKGNARNRVSETHGAVALPRIIWRHHNQDDPSIKASTAKRLGIAAISGARMVNALSLLVALRILFPQWACAWPGRRAIAAHSIFTASRRLRVEWV